ncbi:MAG: hypothetical protein IKF11_01380 [Methanobrevibacter sp.]|nr:hypothetical protein [Methanobrevibacter sp.]
MAQYECMHEEQIQKISQKTAELEAKNGFKEQRIAELIKNNRNIERKIDKLTDTVNQVMLNSVQDDNQLNQRVTSLETQIKTQNEVISKYKEKERKNREEERAKTDQRLAFITVGLAILTFILTWVWK